MGELTPDERAQVAVAILGVALILAQESARMERDRQRPINKAARAVHGLWRTIASGSWE